MDAIQTVLELLYASILHAGDEESPNDFAEPRLVNIERVGNNLQVTLTDGLTFCVTGVCKL